MTSSIPAAVPALLSIAGAALPAGSYLWFGQTLGVYQQPWTMEVTGVHFTMDDPAELGPTYRHEEHYTIACNIVSWAGDSDNATRLQEVYTQYTALAKAIFANPTLNGTVRTAWTRQLSYVPGVDSKGLSVGTLDFEVECTYRASYA